jgi:hypothetical protein
MVPRIGLFRLTNISRSPVAHLLNWVKLAGPPVGAHPKNAGGLVSINADFHPVPWIRCPVNMSSVIDP